MTENAIYGFADDTETSGSSFRFGLNQGVCKLVKFEWTSHGGSGGTEQEALDIVFEIDGREKGYRQFPITRAYDQDGNEVTSPSHPAMQQAAKQFNQRIVHILSCFASRENIQAALNVPISGFKQFCEICQSLLPADYATKPLDCFMQYQWQVSEGQNRTFLEFPKNLKHGKWLCAATTDSWTEKRAANPTDKMSRALEYTNSDGVSHPFTRTGWFMNSPFANQYVDENAESETEDNTSEVEVVEQKSAWSQ